MPVYCYPRRTPRLPNFDFAASWKLLHPLLLRSAGGVPSPRKHIEFMFSKVYLNEISPLEGLASNGRANTSCTVRHDRLIRSRIRQRPAVLRKILKTQIQAFSSADFAVDWPLQAGLFGLLFSYACFLERPRGWADSELVEVCMRTSSNN